MLFGDGYFVSTELWLVTKNLNSQIEFKLARSEGQLGYYDTLTCHHAAADGYHISRFLEELQSDLDSFNV